MSPHSYENEIFHQARAAPTGIIVTKLVVILENLRPRLQAPKNTPDRADSGGK